MTIPQHDDLQVSDFDSDPCECGHEAGRHSFDCCKDCGPARCGIDPCTCGYFMRKGGDSIAFGKAPSRLASASDEDGTPPEASGGC